jgi:peptidoglycan glycosyltransferase
MRAAKTLQRLMLGLMGAFFVVILSAAYWAVFGPGSITSRDDNPRRVEVERAIIRGDIVDRNERLLASTTLNANHQRQRLYHEESTYSFVGYASLRYGVGGTEAAFDTLLRGDHHPKDTFDALMNQMMHIPQQGADVRLSIDTETQNAIYTHIQSSMTGDTPIAGAVVVLDVPRGEVLALLSLPIYDPNSLDANWGSLIEDPGKPFFNRALQGQYQPGATLQTTLMAAALLNNQDINTPIEEANRPVQLANATLECAALRQPLLTLNLREAYTFACPQPFAELAQTLGSQAIESNLNTFHYNNPLMLENYPLPPTSEAIQQVQITPNNLIENALGQASLTVTPLEMALLSAAIINDGNAPQPRILLATREPDQERWTQVTARNATTPYINQNTARQLQDLMRDAVANGAAQNASRQGVDIGGHVALSYSGEETQSWFIGFATIGGNRAISVAVVLENTDDTGLAADIGGIALESAQNAIQRQLSALSN